jgi:N-acetyl-anhydromuramyl-L-alanine amidase AmpD
MGCDASNTAQAQGAGKAPCTASRHIDLIVIHCTATTNKKPVELESIRQEHLRRGFSDIGYHYVIEPNGSVLVGRPESVAGAHAAGYNAHSIGISLVGGLGGPDKRNPGAYTLNQWDSLRNLVLALLERYPGSRVCGHRDLSPDLDGDGEIEPNEWIKFCPCFDVSDWFVDMVPVSEHVLGDN